MTTTPSDSFKTSNTALAAYLIEQGFGMPDIEYNGSRAYWLFPTENPKIKQAVSDFETARAMTNAVLFFNAYQNLLVRIKERF